MTCPHFESENILTLLIPCSSVPSMVGNGVKPIADYEPSMHQNSQNGEFDEYILEIWDHFHHTNEKTFS